MIYTVTFNPAIDYVVRLDAPLEVGEVNRAKGEDCVLGGKGINVSGVLAQLGCESVALGFVAGETGAWLERGLAAQGSQAEHEPPCEKRIEKDARRSLPTRIFCCSLELNMAPYNVKIMRQKRCIESDFRA